MRYLKPYGSLCWGRRFLEGDVKREELLFLFIVCLCARVGSLLFCVCFWRAKERMNNNDDHNNNNNKESLFRVEVRDYKRNCVLTKL